MKRALISRIWNQFGFCLISCISLLVDVLLVLLETLPDLFEKLRDSVRRYWVLSFHLPLKGDYSIRIHEIYLFLIFFWSNFDLCAHLPSDNLQRERKRIMKLIFSFIALPPPPPLHTHTHSPLDSSKHIILRTNQQLKSDTSGRTGRTWNPVYESHKRQGILQIFYNIWKQLPRIQSWAEFWTESWTGEDSGNGERAGRVYTHRK